MALLKQLNEVCRSYAYTTFDKNSNSSPGGEMRDNESAVVSFLSVCLSVICKNRSISDPARKQKQKIPTNKTNPSGTDVASL